MLKNKKGFTLIELVVVMAVIGVLVLLAMPKFMGHTKEARFTRMIANINELEKASERYYIDNEDWPRLTDEAYTKEEIEAFANEIFDKTGKKVELDPNGNYYDIDYKELQKYIQKPKDDVNYIIQNPVGQVFYLDGLTEKAKERTTKSIKPKAVISIPEGVLDEQTLISFSSDLSVSNYGTITNVEWQLDDGDVVSSIEPTKLKAGKHTIKLRVTDSTGTKSNWVEKTFVVIHNDYYINEATVESSFSGQYGTLGVGGTTSSGGKYKWDSGHYMYYEAKNKYIDSGKIYNLESGSKIRFSISAWPGNINFYISKDGQTWTYVGKLYSSVKHTLYSVVYDTSQLPYTDGIRYFRAYTSDSYALDGFRVNIIYE